jgi:Fibronectin type III domain/Domain of unknown function DUF11
MTRSTCSAVAELGKRRGSNIAARVCICLTILLVLAAVPASAQSTGVPPTGTIQILGISPATPAPSNPPTAPQGGIILYGSTINPNTGRPYRHLWIGDSNFGLCRIDPDLDTPVPAGAPSPFNVTVATCPFKVNGLSVTGGPLAFDPTTSNLYLTDEQTNSEGIFRIGFLPSGDGGHGSLDFNNIFAMAGNITGSRFSGGTTGCAFPDDSTETILAPDGVTKIAVPMGVPNSLALGPDGNLYIGFKKQGGILRINNPATASSAGFGTCADFIQLVAATPGGGGNGLAFINHDLWGALEGGPFVIQKADTTCQALPPSINPVQKPTCPAAAPTTPAFAALTPTTIYGDQTYPYLNGNNLYMGDATDDQWVGNVSADPTISGNPATAAFVVDPFEQQPSPAVPGPEPGTVFFLGALPPNVNAITADMTDPANVVAYSGDDPSAAALLAQGRWWQVFQTPSPAAAPPPPTVVRASAVGSTITISWSPAQAGVPVTSYTVHAVTGGVADQIVTAPPAPAGAAIIAPNMSVTFTPNFLVLTGLAAGSYTFEVSATNASGTSAPSTASTAVTLPAVVPPAIPTNIAATAGDSVAFVSFAPPPNAANEGITGYLITATPGPAAATTTPNATTNVVVNGLTDGTTYTFTVHAINAGGKSMESTPSNPVTPIKPPTTVTLALAGPLSVPTVPIMSTFTATVVNTTPNQATGLVLNYNLVTTDGAAVLLGQPGLGTCATVSSIKVTCTLGTLAPGASANINFLVQIKTNSISATAVLTGTATPATGPAVALNITTPVLNTTTPGAPPQGGAGPTLTVTVTGSSAKPQLNTGAGTTHTFVASNTGSILATNLSFTISEPAQLTIGTVTATSSAVGDPVACAAPKAGTLNNLPVNNIVCTIASLGGNLKNGAKPTTAQTITIQVNVTAPAPKLQNPINLAVSSVVAFDGIDAVSPNANFTQTVK